MPSPEDAIVGDLRRMRVTLQQAAHILEMGVQEVCKAVDRQVVTPIYVLRGNRRLRALDGVDMLCLRVRGSLKSPVVMQLYLRLKRAPDGASLKQACHIAVPFRQRHAPQPPFDWIYDTAFETLTDMASLGDDLSRDVGEDGILRNSDVEAHRIAALVNGGMTVEDVLADYPNLDAPRVEAAVRYARINPKQGRPYPGRTVKSVLRTGGGGGLAAAFAAARADDGEIA